MRLMLDKKMKLGAAKKYVCDKLGITLDQLCDSTFMLEFRRDKGYGVVMPYHNDIYGLEAKARIADVLGLTINSIEKFKEKSLLIK